MLTKKLFFYLRNTNNILIHNITINNTPNNTIKMSIPINAYVFDYKDDEATSRFYTKLMEAITQPEKLVTPTSNSSASSKPANPLQDIVNLAFSSAPETAKSLNPVMDIIMDAFTTITSPEPQKRSEVKKPVAQPTPSASCCPVTKYNSNGSGVTQSGCPFIGTKTKDVSTKLEKLRAEVKTLHGGENYLKKVDTDADNVIAHLLEKQYQELLAFRENAKPPKVRTSIADVVHRLKPNVLLPENAKNTLVTYVNARRMTLPYLHKFDTKFEVESTPNGLERIYAIVTQWLNENSGMYVVV